MELIDIYDAYEQARKGSRGADAVSYAVQRESNLRRLCDAVNSRTLDSPCSVFVSLRSAPRQIISQDMTIKTLAKWYDGHMRPIYESNLSDRTYNNRIGKGCLAAVNQLAEDIAELSEWYTRPVMVIGQDIQACYPSADLEVIYDRQERLILDNFEEGSLRDDLLYVARRLTYALPTDGSITRLSSPEVMAIIPKHKDVLKAQPGKGGLIGSLFFQFAMGWNFNDFDHLQTDRYGFRYVRFMDDMRWVVRAENVPEFLAMIPSQREELAKVGMTLHPRKFSCQRADHGVNFVGRTIKMSRIYPSRRIVRSAFARLAELNKRPSLRNVDAFVASCNSYMGIFKTCNGYKILRRFVEAIDERWLQWVSFDERRMCLSFRGGYAKRDRLFTKYKIKNHDAKRKRRKAQQPIFASLG